MLKNDLMKMMGEMPDDANLRLVISCENEDDALDLLYKLKKKGCGVVLHQSAFGNWEISVIYT